MKAADARAPDDAAAQKPAALLWRTVQVELEQEILDGALAPGQRLPTEDVLAARFDVHRHTIRRAIARLRDKHLLRTEQGRGTFVAEHQLNYRVGRDTRLTVSAVRSDKKPARRVLSARRVKADKATAYHLSLPLHHPVLAVKMIRELDERTISSALTFYPLPRFDGIGVAIEECGSITGAMARFGVTEFPRRSTGIRAASATAADAQLLGVARRSPLLELTHVNVDRSDVPVQVMVTRLNSSLINLIFDF